MINIYTPYKSLLNSSLRRTIIIIILMIIGTPGFAQLFVQSSAQTNGQGNVPGNPMVGTPAANVIFSSAGKVNPGINYPSPPFNFGLGNMPCTNGYAGFNSEVGINTYSTNGPAIEITLSPSANYVLSATGISAKMRRSNTGPANATYAYSTDGGTSWINNGTISLPNVNCQLGTVFTWNFACPIIVSDVQIFKFRVYIYGSTGSDGTTQIENLTVNGTAIACTALTAAISGTTSICAGANTSITFTGTPLSTVVYNINGGSNLTIALNCTGIATLNTGALIANTTYNLVSVALGTCNKVVSGNAVVTVVPAISSAVISGTNTICSASTTNLVVNITGGIGPYTVVYFNGTANTTVNSYISGSNIPVSPTVNTTYTLVSVTGSGSCGASPSNTGTAVITMAPAATASVISGTASICTGSGTNLSVAITGGVSPYTVVYNPGSVTLNNYVSGTLIPVTPASTTTYTITSVTGANSCAGTGNSGSAIITVTAPGTWKGINTNWHDPQNWCDGNIPTLTTNVIIPTGVPFYPVITTTTPQVRNINIEPGANINIAAGGIFSIAGSTTNSGTITNNGTIAINGTTGVQIFPVPGSIPVMNNLTINNASGVNMGNNFTVGGTLTLTNGVYTVGIYSLTIANPLAGTVGNLSASNTSSIAIVGTAAGVNLPASISQLKNFTISNSSGTVLQGNLNVATLVQIAGAAGTVDVGSYTLNGAAGLTMSNGNLRLSKDAVVLPELTGTYTLTGGTVTFNGTRTGINAQTIRPVNYFNLTSTSTGDRMLSSSGTIGISNVFTPSVNTYTITGSTVNFNKANNQNIPGFKFYNLTLSGGNFTKTLTGDISIESTLTFAVNTKLALANQDVHLKSGASNTASVANIPTANSITYGTGRFIVERYIPVGITHAKSWQLLSVPTTTGQTVKDAWQETATGGPTDNPNPGYGTQLTNSSPNALALGFDFYTLAGSTIKTYNSSLNRWDSIASTSIPIANTKGYMLFVRGDRSVTAYNQAAVPTIMRTKGKLYSPGTEAPAFTSVAGGKFESVGNPYASAIDLTVVNSLQTGDVQNIYYVWDPLLTTGPNSAYGLGGYRTFSFNGTNYDVTPPGGSYGATAKYIQSGQAFLVKSFSVGGTVNFTENCKAAGSALVTRPVNDTMAKIRTNLYVMLNQAPILIDGVMQRISSGFLNGLDKEDGLKIIQSGESVSILTAGKKLSVDSKNLLNESDTIEFRFEQLKQRIYQLEFIPEKINRPDLTAYLTDRFLHTQTAISLFDTTRILFEPDMNIPLSFAADRFYIVFTKTPISPAFSFIDVTARRTSTHTVLVEWEAKNENAIAGYEIERSPDQHNFYTLGNAVPYNGLPGIKQYQFMDGTVTKETNYYRIRATSMNGDITFSNICKVDALDRTTAIIVYPNPVVNKKITILFRNQPAGEYNIQLINKLGQIVLNKQVSIDNNIERSISFSLNNAIAKGFYHLTIRSEKGIKNEQQLIVR